MNPRILLHGLGVQAGMGCVIFFLSWHLLHFFAGFHSIYGRLPGALIYRLLFLHGIALLFVFHFLPFPFIKAPCNFMVLGYPGFIHGYGVPNGWPEKTGVNHVFLIGGWRFVSGLEIRSEALLLWLYFCGSTFVFSLRFGDYN